MKIFDTKQNRNDYFKTQIARSRKKFSYCKVSHNHVKTWKKVITGNFSVIDNFKGPILCLGTRNGREIDLFRSVFYQVKMINYLVHLLEIKRDGWNSLFPLIEGMRKSSLDNIIENSVTGVELNPDVKRPDVFIGSFDEMPLKWADTFGILYSNSFDQSYDPYKSAKEWIRVLKGGGVLIIGFNYAKPNVHDPTGELTYQDILKLFPGELLYYRKLGSNYNDLIIKIDKKT